MTTPALMAETRPSGVAERLLALPDAEFATVVGNDVRRKARATTAAALRDPRLWERWEDALRELLERVDGQLASKRAADEPEWRTAVSAFRRHAERRLTEVRELRAGNRGAA
jgi:hypothetical protein